MKPSTHALWNVSVGKKNKKTRGSGDHLFLEFDIDAAGNMEAAEGRRIAGIDNGGPIGNCGIELLRGQALVHGAGVRCGRAPEIGIENTSARENPFPG